MARALFDFSRTKLDLRRPLSSYSKVQALVSAVIRNRKVFARVGVRGCYLDLGCGPNSRADFCNLDYNWHPGIDVCWDVTRRLPFDDSHVAGIFTEHMIEHLALGDTLPLLRECRRILRPGGVLRIIVPDGGIYLAEYTKHQAGQPASMPYGEDERREFPLETPIVSINRIFSGHGHQFIWDFETLREALLGAGFARVERCAFGQGQDAKLLRDSQHRRIESLYVEAI
jgi:predicted SAM-dependent methyltransferase